MVKLAFVLNGLLLISSFSPAGYNYAAKQELEITLDSAFISAVYDSVTCRLSTALTLKNASDHDIAVMEYSCLSGVKPAFNIVLYDSASSRLYTLPQYNIYDISPERPSPNQARPECYSYYFLKKGESRHVRIDFRLYTGEEKSSKNNLFHLVNLNDLNDVYKGKFKNLEARVQLSQYPCRGGVDSAAFSRYTVPGVYSSGWCRIR